jgi:hypothetical protein
VATRQFVLPFAASRLTHHLGVELAFGHAELRRPNLLCGTQSEKRHLCAARLHDDHPLAPA